MFSYGFPMEIQESVAQPPGRPLRSSLEAKRLHAAERRLEERLQKLVLSHGVDNSL